MAWHIGLHTQAHLFLDCASLPPFKFLSHSLCLSLGCPGVGFLRLTEADCRLAAMVSASFSITEVNCRLAAMASASFCLTEVSCRPPTLAWAPCSLLSSLSLSVSSCRLAALAWASFCLTEADCHLAATASASLWHHLQLNTCIFKCSLHEIISSSIPFLRGFYSIKFSLLFRNCK